MSKPKPVAARSILIVDYLREHGSSPGCCATGCGDKIKHLGRDDLCYEITWSDGSVSHLEQDCVDWFVNGHPDYGFGYGSVPGLQGAPMTSPSLADVPFPIRDEQERLSNPIRFEHLAQGDQLIVLLDAERPVVLLFGLLCPSRTIRSELGHSDASIKRSNPLLLVTLLKHGQSLLIEPGPALVLTAERVSRQLGVSQKEAGVLIPFIRHVAKHVAP